MVGSDINGDSYFSCRLRFDSDSSSRYRALAQRGACGENAGGRAGRIITCSNNACVAAASNITGQSTGAGRA